MASIKFIQRTKKLANGEYGIYLRIIKDRKDRFIFLNLSCSTNDWNAEKQEFKKSCNDYVIKNHTLKGIRSRAEVIFAKSYEKGIDVTIEEFKSQFVNFKKDKKITVLELWEDLIADLKNTGRVGNANVYFETKRSFTKFLNSRTIYFQDITPLLLSKYELFLRERNNKETTISVRMRTIRALYNDAILKGFAHQEYYPFDKYNVSKLRTETERRALNYEDMQKLINLDISEYPNLVDTKNYFLFSYFLGGINFVDLIQLKWSNIIDNRIRYVRSKTKGVFDFAIQPHVESILSYYRRKPQTTDYIFPILLHNNLSPQQILYRKTKTLKKFNSELKELAKLAGIESKLTSYVARHSFATNLKQLGESIEVIAETLGHKNVSYTVPYLKSFDKSVLDKAMEKLS